MAHTGNFTAIQSTDGQDLVVTDTSTDVDPNLTGRKIYLVKHDGTYLTPAGSGTDYIDFPLTDGSVKTISGILARDYDLLITVEWSSSSPEPGGIYTKTILYLFTINSELFYYSLTQLQVSNPFLINNNHYFYNKLKLRVAIDDAENAHTIASDQGAAQLALNRAYQFELNRNTYF